MGHKAKVLQLIESWGPGGAEKVVLELAKRMDRSRFHPLVGLLHTGWLHQQLERYGIETFLLDNNYACDPIFLWKLWKLVKDKGVDMIHSHEFTMNVYGALAARVAGIPSLVTVHGSQYYPDKKRRRKAYQWVASFPRTELVTVSRSLQKYFCGVTGVNPANVHTVYNGVDCSIFNGRGSREPYVQYDKTAGPIIGTIGNLYPDKGHIFLIRAASLLAARLPSARILIIGKNTPFRSELESEAKKLNVEDNIQFLGFQEDVSSILKRLDIFVLPSLHETFSIAVIEAMAVGLPVIATRCGGPEEIIADGVNGVLVPPRDHQAIAEKMFLLLRDAELRQKVARKAREQVVKNYTLETMTSHYQNLYCAMTERGEA